MSVVADELTLKIDSNVTGAIAGMTAVETKSKSMASKVSRSVVAFGAKATAAVGIAAAATGFAAGKMATSFEKSMAQIEALVGVPKDEMESLGDAALSMGKRFGVSADEAAGGLFFLKSAGLSTKDAITALEQAAMASAIGLGTMEDLANTATTATSNFGITSEQAFDAIGTAAKLAKADPAELGRIMNRNSATANLLGVSYNELGGLSALLTRKFGDAAMSGTALGAVMNKVVKPSRQAQEMLAKVGMSATDLKDAVREQGLSAALTDLNRAFADSGIATDEWLGKVMEDSRGIKGAAAILGTGADEFDEIFSGMENSAGMVNEGWEVMSNTASVKMSRAMESVKSALIPVGLVILDVVVPAIQVLGDWITKGVEWFNDLIHGAEGVEGGVGEAFSGMAEKGQELLKALGRLWDAISPILTKIGEIFVEVFLEIVVPAFEVLLGWITDAITWFADLVAGADGLEDGLDSAFGGIMSLVEGVRAWWDDHFEDIREIVDKFRSHFEDVVQDILDYAQPKLDEMAAFFTETFGGMIDWFKENWPYIKETIEIVLDKIKALWDFLWPYLQLVLDDAWNVMKAVITTAIGVIQGILEVVMGIIRGDWEQAWGGIKKIFSSIWDGMWRIVSSKINLIKGVISRVLGGIRDTIGRILGGIKSAWTTSWNGLKGAVTGAFSDVRSAVVDKFNGVKSRMSGIMDKVKEAWNTAWDGLKGAVTGAFSGIADAVQGPIDTMLGILTTGINKAIDALNKAIDGANLINPFKDIPKIGHVAGPRMSGGGGRHRSSGRRRGSSGRRHSRGRSHHRAMSDGGLLEQSGLVKVGDAGPELLHLPRGAAVTPLRASGAGDAGASIHIEHLHSGANPLELADALGWELRKRGM